MASGKIRVRRFLTLTQRGKRFEKSIPRSPHRKNTPIVRAYKAGYALGSKEMGRLFKIHEEVKEEARKIAFKYAELQTKLCDADLEIESLRRKLKTES